MILTDSYDAAPLLRRPPVAAALTLALFLVFWLGHVLSWPTAQAALSLIGLHPPPDMGVSASALLAALTVGLLIGLSGLPRRFQGPAVWLVMAALLAVFFVSFNLSWGFIRRKIWILLSIGLMNTLMISAASILLACALASAGALAKLSGNAMAQGLAGFYTSFFRGIPLLMQVYVIYLGLPQVGVVIDAIPAGILALSLCYGAYMTEIFRAGVESVPRGQWEAARALGLKPVDVMWRVIMPQAIRVILPPVGNQFIAMLKDSSLVSVIGVWELMYLARTQGQSEFRHIEMMLTASLIYWLFSMLLELIQARIEARLGRAHAR